MKLSKGAIIALYGFFACTFLFADTQIEKVKLDTKIVKVDLDEELTYYYIDVNACICWLRHYAPPTVTGIDCKKLKVYPSLVKYLEKCN